MTRLDDFINNLREDYQDECKLAEKILLDNRDDMLPRWMDVKIDYGFISVSEPGDAGSKIHTISTVGWHLCDSEKSKKDCLCHLDDYGDFDTSEDTAIVFTDYAEAVFMKNKIEAKYHGFRVSIVDAVDA
jgi:hypothetical protein